MSQRTEQVLQQFKESIPLLEVLTDENRQAIIMVLAQNKSGLNVNAIAGHINLSRPAVSHHLKVLKQSGYIQSEKKGVENYYILTVRKPLEQLKTLITAIEAECTWPQ
ncbi:metalloregulator ArsR/SmtB family transcription factor [Paenibacillus lautus]|uniref:ArsR family transcriptional regulator n=1 Tax=Paenibacillus lautus TaxID=1401 RepID=A0A385TIV6_PAELA|nr:metalloregulator ArsR/SmtB family transcription factor [Paenibacillus lautus]AYB44440.1 ArsR family transcriptional regulator [Paenibacillus lautus]MBX4148678.1 metalloregulator ArsR/SmtB family transcription factor [Paenibacillus lautus]MBY0162055.1 winged helix-turn-helix transcriptional regulator [Cytobacillus firmus]VTR62539.1 ArsR family transcriptional regulator [Actinobacillus pleuropneumoniae]